MKIKRPLRAAGAILLASVASACVTTRNARVAPPSQRDSRVCRKTMSPNASRAMTLLENRLSHLQENPDQPQLLSGR